MARGVLGRGDRSRGERIQAHPGAIRARRRRGDFVLALHQRGGVPGSEARAHGVRQQQHRHLRPGLPFADRLRPVEDLRDLGRHAGLQVGRQGGCRRGDRRQSDRRPSGVRLAPQEAPARGRPPHRRRPAPHRPRAEPACRGRLPSGAETRHERRGPQCARARGRHRRPDRQGLRRRAVRSGQFRGLGALCRRAASCARGGRGSDRRRPARAAQGGPALCDGRKRSDLLRPRRHRARPRLDRRDGDRQSRHGDRQYRPGGRRGEPAARPEQRAGILRHGLVPARILGLPARLRRRDAGDFRAPVGRDAQQRAGPQDPQHDGRGDRGRVQGALSAGRGHRPVRSRHEAHHGGPQGHGMRRRPGPVSQRNRALRPRLPARRDVPGEGRHVHQRRAPHRPGAQGDRAARRQGRLGDDDRLRRSARRLDDL